jgi:hypothetical protein
VSSRKIKCTAIGGQQPQLQHALDGMRAKKLDFSQYRTERIKETPGLGAGGSYL